MTKLWMTTPVALLFALSTWAAGDKSAEAMQKKQGAQQQAAANQPAMAVDDVETIMDDVSKYAGKRVSVKGAVSNKLGARTLVLESGGLFNDEITVVTGADSKAADALLRAREDAELQVTGQIVTVPRVEIERQYGWDLDPELEVEFEGVKAYLVADDVKVVEKE